MRVIYLLLGFGFVLLFTVYVVFRSATPQFYPVDHPVVQGRSLEEDWIRFEQERLGFSVLLPTLPLSSQTQVEGALYDMFSAKDPDGRTFSVNVVTFFDEVALDQRSAAMQRLLDSTLPGDLSSVNRVVEEGELGGNPYLLYRYQGVTMMSSGILVAVGRRVYFLLYLDRASVHSEELHQLFVGSFQLGTAGL